jgi:UPF0271 protein
MRGRYDLNADVGEGFAEDEELLGVITSANVACGFHAGSRETMRWICGLAADRDVAVGAQVSYRDREGFGRRRVEVGFTELVADLAEQVETLQAEATGAGVSVCYVKPHGALYNRCVDDREHSAAVVDVCGASRLPVLGLPGSVLLRLAAEAGVEGRREFFADRGYDVSGRLVPRGEEGSVISDATQVARRVRDLVGARTVVARSGEVIQVRADSICVHGDSPGAAALARRVRDVLEQEGVMVSSALWDEGAR